jgi:hypothetical protein
MSTPKQIAASRANGAKSKGPVTPQGKINSSRNSIRHGLLAETVVLEAEDKAQFLQLLEELFEEHQPTTPTERMLVETIAVARWRQDRVWGMQKVALDHDIANSDSATSNPLRAVLSLRGSAETVRSHELLLRYEIALDRQLSRAIMRLQQLQERTPAKRTQQLVENPPEVGRTAGSAAGRPAGPQTSRLPANSTKLPSIVSLHPDDPKIPDSRRNRSNP